MLKYLNVERFIHLGWADGAHGETIALAMFVLLALYLYIDSRRARKED